MQPSTVKLSSISSLSEVYDARAVSSQVAAQVAKQLTTKATKVHEGNTRDGAFVVLRALLVEGR